MRRMWLLVPLLLVAFAGLAGNARFAGGVLAQEATPTAEEEEFALAEGVEFEVLGFGVAEELPAAPTDLALFRLTFAPGAGLELEPESTVAIVYVEAGELTVTMDTGMTVLRAAGAGTPFPSESETFAAGETFTFAAGDSAVFPAGSGGEVRNEGAEAASVLVADIGPAEDADGAPGAGQGATPTS